MPKKDLAVTGEKAKSKKFREIEDIMRDPAMRGKLMSLIDEAVNAKTRIAAEQATIKDLRDTALEDLGLKPALFNQHVALAYNNDYTDRKEALEQSLTLVEILMGQIEGNA
jgi:hypothetical protein